MVDEATPALGSDSQCDCLHERLEVLQRNCECLQRNEEKFRTLIETTGTGYVILDLEGRVVDANQEYVRLAGYSQLTEILGRSVVEWTAPEERERNAQEVARCIECGTVRDFGIHYVATDGRRTPIEINATVVGEGANAKIITICRDITKRRQIEDDQRVRDARFRAIVETTQEWIWAIDLQGNHTYSNRAVEAILGYSVDALLQMPTMALLHPDDVTKVAELLASCAAARKGWSGFIVRWRHKDGSYRFLESCAVPEFDAENGLVGFRGSDRDITEREQARQALAESEARFRTTFEQAAVGIVHVSPEGRFLRVNRRFCDIVGYSRDAILGMTFQEITYAEDLGRDVTELDRLASGDSASYTREKRYVRRDGGLAWVNLTASVHRLEDGTVDYFISVVEDISERKRAERALRFTQFAVDHAGEACFWMNDQARVLYANREACLSLGYTKEELQVLTLFDFAPDLSKAGWPERWQRMGQIPTLHLESRHRSKDGRTFPVEIAASRVEFEGESFACAFARDVTERKRSEAEKERLQSQLLQSQKMDALGRLAGGIAHDFNNLLTGILGFSELARIGLEPDSEAAEHLLGISEIVTQGKALTSQILAVSRKQVLSMAIIDVNAMILSAGRMLRRIIGEDLEIRTVLEPELLLVRADGAQLQQILLNLAVNARDAMPHGGVLCITTRNTTLSDSMAAMMDLSPGQYVQIAVSDTGCGIASDVIDHVFEPFFTTKQSGRGTGLGLATVYGIVKQHGGYIEVDSEAGKGSNFRILLAGVQEQAMMSVPSKLTTLVHGTETVLVVEDNFLVRHLVEQYLSSYGYEVLVATEPIEAIGLSRQHEGPIAILVTDVVMPGMNGRELHDRLIAERPNLEVIYMSGYAGDVLIDPAGAVDLSRRFLQKPFEMVELGRRIRSILDAER